MNETILTEEQKEQLVDTLTNNRNESDELMKQIEEYTADRDNSNDPLEEGTGTYLGGGAILCDEDDDDNDLDFSHFENIDCSEETFAENLKEALNDRFELDDEEALKFAELIINIRNNKQVNIYDNLPKVVKDNIEEMIKEENIDVKDRITFRNYIAKNIIDELITDTEFDALTIDLEKAMMELLPAPVELYSEINKNYIENEFVTVAEKIKETEPKKADNLLKMRQGFIDAYTFEPMYELFKDNKILNKIRKADKFWNRISSEYSRIAGVCKFKLYGLNDICKSLETIGINKDTAQKITSLFVYTYTNGIEDSKNEEEYNDIYRNSFANYFQLNVRNLALAPNTVSDFAKQIKESFFNLANHIETSVAERERELLSNKKQRR